MEVLISPATKRNWHKLNVTSAETKLTKRANKTNSKKRILPVEYLSDSSNIPMIEQALAEIFACRKCVFDIMYSIVLNYFRALNITNGVNHSKSNVQRFLLEYADRFPIQELFSLELPLNESDILGFIYQTLCVEGEKNKQGLYYTPTSIARLLSEGMDFSKDQIILDPCCGSGSFLMNASVMHPRQLYGIDCDPIAVMLCKANLIVKFKEFDFYPQVFCFDFLGEPNLLDSCDVITIRNKKFDYISTNPPWGAISRESSHRLNGKESFAEFLSKSLEKLENNGVLCFLLPESFLNVKTYSQLRMRLIKSYAIKKIQLFTSLFTGVTTKVVALTVANRARNRNVIVTDGTRTQLIGIHSFLQSQNCIFSRVASKDRELLEIMSIRGQHNLSNSIWALGIVTGNNEEKLSDTPLEKGEPIYTGKEICAYKLLSPRKYIIYDRANFQQVAKEEIYRAHEKLVYKFISNKLVFAYDNNQSLFLNSANILIPNIPSISIQSMLVFLNSELFQFAYIKRFGEIKILKGNLCELSFPSLLPHEDIELKVLAKNIIYGDKLALAAAQDTIYKFYNLSKQQIQYVQGVLKNGTPN